MIRVARWSAVVSALLAGGLVRAAEPPRPAPAEAKAGDVPRVILDSDMSSDHDDVGDIATLHGLAALGEVRIIGMMVSSKNYGTAQLMDAINTWYGKPGIPIGIPPEIGGVGEYPGMTIGTGRWPHAMGATKEAGLASGRCLWARDLYRKLLAESPDHSVVIVTTGYLQNVAALMDSAPDRYSPLDGMDLIRRKVRLLSCAGGCYPRGNEFNFRVGDTMPRPAFRVVNDWPTSAWYVGYDVGQAIYTGGLLPEARADSPIRYVYVDSRTEDYPYPSWGQIMVYYAARGLDTFWTGETAGRNNADKEGFNWWSATPDPSGAQEQGYLQETARTPVRESIDALIMLEPNDGKPCRPGQPSNLRAAVRGARVDLAWRDNAYNESGFRIERGVNGVYAPIGDVGANVTRFSDTGLASVAAVGYRVAAFNAQGDSRPASTWVYSGWTDLNRSTPGDVPLYSRYQPCHLRWARGLATFDHLALNNDSTHGPDLTLDVDVGGLNNGGAFHVYVLYQNPRNWYRLVYDQTGAPAFRFEKCIDGAIAAVGTPRALARTLPVQRSEHALHGIGYGSRLRPWRIRVTPGSLTFTTSNHARGEDGTMAVSTITLEAKEPLVLDRGLIGLGASGQSPIWENVRFTAPGAAGLAPTIAAQPLDRTVVVNRPAAFSVAACGSGPLRYQWKRGATPVGTDGPTLALGRAQPADAGPYTCTVGNDGGTATSNPASLETVAALDPLIQPAALFNDGGGTYGGYPNTADKAYDGDTGTFYDAKAVSGAYAGIDVGAGKAAAVTAIRHYARAGQAGRMIGGTFEGSNAQADGYVTLATVTAASDQAWTTVLVKGAAPYRYLRYRGPDNGSCNVAEVEFHGTVRGGR